MNADTALPDALDGLGLSDPAIRSVRISPNVRILVAISYAFALICFAGFQIAFEADGVSLFALMVISLLTLMPLFFSEWTAADLLWLLFSAYGGFFTLAVKTWVGQPIEQNLSTPTESAIYLLMSYVCSFIGYILARNMVRPRSAPFNLTVLTSDPLVLRRFSMAFFVIGVAAQFAHNILRPRFAAGATEQTEGFGGFGALAVFWLVGLAFEVAVWRQHRGSFLRVAIMVTALLALAVFSNIKKPVFDGLFLISLGIFLLQGKRIKMSTILSAAIPSVFLIMYLAPLIQVMRPQLVTYYPSEVVSVALESLAAANYNPAALSDRADEISQGYTFSFRPEANYLYPSTINADRFALIMPLDQIVRALPSAGVLGLSSLQDVPETYLPSFAYDKRGVSSVDIIGWHYGMRRYGSVSRPVIGLPGSTIALAGPYGGAVIAGLAIFVFYALINYLAGPLGGGAWSIFIVASFIQKAAERELAALINTGAREVPTILVIGLIVAFATRFFSASRRTRF